MIAQSLSYFINYLQLTFGVNSWRSLLFSFIKAGAVYKLLHDNNNENQRTV